MQKAANWLDTADFEIFCFYCKIHGRNSFRVVMIKSLHTADCLIFILKASSQEPGKRLPPEPSRTTNDLVQNNGKRTTILGVI